MVRASPVTIRVCCPVPDALEVEALFCPVSCCVPQIERVGDNAVQSDQGQVATEVGEDLDALIRDAFVSKRKPEASRVSPKIPPLVVTQCLTVRMCRPSSTATAEQAMLFRVSVCVSVPTALKSFVLTPLRGSGHRYLRAR